MAHISLKKLRPQPIYKILLYYLPPFSGIFCLFQVLIPFKCQVLGQLSPKLPSHLSLQFSLLERIVCLYFQFIHSSNLFQYPALLEVPSWNSWPFTGQIQCHTSVLILFSLPEAFNHFDHPLANLGFLTTLSQYHCFCLFLKSKNIISDPVIPLLMLLSLP